MNLNPFRRNRHERWQNDLDAYVDGELPAPAALRFEQHLAACDSCAGLLDLTRATKAAIVALPPLQASRSFALTEAMLTATPALPPPRRAPGMAYRLAQATAFAALAGFATLVVVDVSSGNGGSRDTAATAGLSALSDEQPLPASTEEAGASSLVPDQSGGGITDDSSGDPANDGGVGAAGSDEEFGSDPGDNGDAGERADDPEEKIGAPAGGGALEPPASLKIATGDEDGGPGGLRLVQITLGLLALAAAGAWWLLRRQQRISW